MRRCGRSPGSGVGSPFKPRAWPYGVEKVRQFVVATRDAEHRPAWLEGETRSERPDVNGVEAQTINELHDRGECTRIIGCDSHG
jgi:hypothetical protein